MAEASAINDLWQLTVEGEIEGQFTANVWHFKTTAASADVDLGLVLVFLNCFITNLLPVLTSKYTLNGVRWKKVAPVLGNEFFHPAPPASVGGGDDNAEPSFVSALFSIRTSLGGRSHRGRKYIAGIPEDQTDGSRIFAEPDALWAALLAFAACVIGAFVNVDLTPATSGFQLGVYSRKLGGAAFPFGAAGFTPAVSMTPDRQLATTRSRKVGRGR